MKAKRLAGEKAAEYVKNGMFVGLGTGSTAYWAIQKLSSMVKAGLKIKAVPTSKETAELARKGGIELIELADIEKLDLTIDGADEVDSELNLIKGGGGALLREKIVASASDKLIIVADESKLSARLGSFPLAVEICKFSWEFTKRQIEKLGCSGKLRENEDGETFITDNENYIIDCDFSVIDKPVQMAVDLNRIPGVVENGIFPEMADVIVVGYKNGDVRIIEK
ncbi:MAG: ribose-5-phosphate isomerase RpiA [Bacillota bacterium]